MPPRGEQRERGSGHLPFAGEEGRFFALQKFNSLNTKAKRPAIEDEEFSWLENFMPIGDGNLRTTPSNGSALFTASGALTIIYVFFYNIGVQSYAAVFLSDGTAIQINTATGVQTTISSFPGTFYGGGSLPAAAQWGSSGIVIVSQVSSSGYWAWDGTTLFPPGSASPSWLNGGTPTTMPNGLSGNAIEIFQSRAWVFNNGVGNFSAPSNGASFSGALGGGSFPSTDSFLRRSFVAARQSNGFLYVWGDSSINVISNVQTSGSPTTTTFNNQNIDPQIGTPWPNSVQAYGRGLLFGNATGAYSLVGGAAEKISDKLDGFFLQSQSAFSTLNPTASPSAAVAILYGIRVYCFLMPVQDLFTGQIRNVLQVFDGKKWFMASQDSSLVFVATQEINSVLTAWGTNGTSLFQLFATPSATLRKIIQSKLWSGDGFVITKDAFRHYLMATDNSGGGYALTGTVDMQNETGPNSVAVSFSSATFAIIWLNATSGVIQWQNGSSQNITFTVAGLSLGGANVNATGALLGVTLQSTSADFTVVAYGLLYRNKAPIGG